MPKFLDAPSWYDAGGRETDGWGLTPYYPQGDLLSNLPTGRYLLVGPSGTGLVSELVLNIQNSSGSYQTIKIKASASWSQYGNSNGVPCIMTVYNNLSNLGSLSIFFENVMSDSNTYGAITPTECSIFRGARMYLKYTKSGSGYNLTDSWGFYAGNTNGYSLYNASSVFLPPMASQTGLFLRSVGGGGPVWDTNTRYYCKNFSNSASLYINNTATSISTSAYNIFLIICTNGTIEEVSLGTSTGGSQSVSGFSNASRAVWASFYIPSSAGSRNVYVNGMKCTSSSVAALNSTLTGVSSAVDKITISLTGSSTVGSYLMLATKL